MLTQSATLQLLLAKFKGQLLIPFVPASFSIGMAAQTARNKLSKGTFPVATVVIDNRRYIHIDDLAKFIESLRQPLDVISERKPVKKGRPLNSDKYKMQRVVR